MAPGLYLRIQDELSLWEDELWVNDRGHNANTGDMVYGNHNGVPYKMNRVSSLVPLSFARGEAGGDKQDEGKIFERKIVDDTLSWTLGGLYRTTEEYDSKMVSIGGTSTSISTPYRPKKA